MPLWKQFLPLLYSLSILSNPLQKLPWFPTLYIVTFVPIQASLLLASGLAKGTNCVWLIFDSLALTIMPDTQMLSKRWVNKRRKRKKGKAETMFTSAHGRNGCHSVVDLSGMLGWWAGEPLLSYSCLICCKFKGRKKSHVSCHGADITLPFWVFTRCSALC